MARLGQKDRFPDLPWILVAYAGTPNAKQVWPRRKSLSGCRPKREATGTRGPASTSIPPKKGRAPVAFSPLGGPRLFRTKPGVVLGHADIDKIDVLKAGAKMSFLGEKRQQVVFQGKFSGKTLQIGLQFPRGKKGAACVNERRGGIAKTRDARVSRERNTTIAGVLGNRS